LSVLKVLDPRLVAARAIVRDAAWAPIGGALLTAAIMLPSWQLHQEWRKVGPFLPTYIVPLRDLRGPEAAALALAGELCRERTPSRTDGLLTAPSRSPNRASPATSRRSRLPPAGRCRARTGPMATPSPPAIRSATWAR
jgi:hypothetical protein